MRDRSEPRTRILAVCAIDIMAWKLLRPWFRALADAGYELHIACAKTDYFTLLEAEGFHMHEIPVRRRMNPFLHLMPLFALYRLIRDNKFDAVNMHSPVAAAIGRVAGRLACAKTIIYTVHGFYFHDDMPAWKRRSFIALEWLLGRATDYFMFVSDEDRKTALAVGIAANPATAVTIYNGVDLTAYRPQDRAHSGIAGLRSDLDIPATATIVGIVGRVVREKGYFEFAGMAKIVSVMRDDVYFLAVGDALASDRDGIASELHRFIEDNGLKHRFRFTGFTDRVAEYLQMMDIFVLPSYREGFPRSVLEAMSTALPVVATNIRGCREAVVPEETGLLVPPRESKALADAVLRLLKNPQLASRMGVAGRERAVRLYSQTTVQKLFVEMVSRAIHERASPY